MSEPYRPSNGTEGECFIGEWCGSCERSGADGKPDDEGHELIGCGILSRTFRLDVDDPEYPPEWVIGERGPECLAWIPLGDPIPVPRCTATTDMFSDCFRGPETRQ